MSANEHAKTVRDPLAVLRERIEVTRQRYGFPDIEDRYPGALLEAFLLRDAIALVTQAGTAEARVTELETALRETTAELREMAATIRNMP